MELVTTLPVHKWCLHGSSVILSLRSIRMLCSGMCRCLRQKLEKYVHQAADLILNSLRVVWGRRNPHLKLILFCTVMWTWTSAKMTESKWRGILRVLARECGFSLWGFTFIHILFNTYHLFLSYTVLLYVKWYHMMAVICTSLIINDVEYHFVSLLAICISSSENWPLNYFAHF